MRRIYMASSWRNPLYENLVSLLRAVGHEVYDWRNPPEPGKAFRWEEIDADYKNWNASMYRDALKTAPAQRGFKADFTGMKWADTCILLLPSGRSAHLEAGWMIGHGKRSIIWTHDGEEPELMNLLADVICIRFQEVVEALTIFDEADRG